MIVSTLQSGVGERAEDRGGGAGTVGHAEQRDPGLLGRVGDGGDQGRSIVSSSPITKVPGLASKLDRQWIRTPWLRAYSTERSCSTLAPGGGHLEHLLEADHRQLARVRHDPRVGGEHAGDVGVDLAHLGVDRRRQRDRGGVRAAAAERGHVAAGRDALEAGDEHDQVVVERLADPVGADVEDPGLGVRGVGDDPGLRAGQRDRRGGRGR